MASTQKSVHTMVLDAGPILKNNPTVSVLVAKCETLVTVPSVLSEIRDVNARSRVETLLRPFLTIRCPRSESIKFVIDFSRRTGDLPVLSKPDVQILALAYELELERNNGDWRLRRTPGQKVLNGSPPKPQSDSLGKAESASEWDSDYQPPSDGPIFPAAEESPTNAQGSADDQKTDYEVSEVAEKVAENVDNLQLEAFDPELASDTELPQHGDADPSEEMPAELESESSDSDGWITPSNLKKQQAKDQNASTVPISDDQVMQVATITTDFAMQVRTSPPETTTYNLLSFVECTSTNRPKSSYSLTTASPKHQDLHSTMSCVFRKSQR